MSVIFYVCILYAPTQVSTWTANIAESLLFHWFWTAYSRNCRISSRQVRFIAFKTAIPIILLLWLLWAKIFKLFLANYNIILLEDWDVQSRAYRSNWQTIWIENMFYASLFPFLFINKLTLALRSQLFAGIKWTRLQNKIKIKPKPFQLSSLLW